MIKGLIFNIQRYSVHDGPGIRTLVFMKGCPLRCLWCCNPEGQNPWPEIMYYRNLCILCGKCVKVCPAKANTLGDGEVIIDRKKCNACGLCVKACPSNARKLVGNYVTVNDVLSEVLKDVKFYVRSGGGLTVGGGEPLSQEKFVSELLRRAKDYLIHTAIETSLYASPNVVRDVLRYIDYLFVDIKHSDPIKHVELTGVSNELILNNIRMIVNESLINPDEFVIRVPVIPNVNDDLGNLQGIAEFIRSLRREIPMELLPYHEFGRPKYEALGRIYPLSKFNTFIPDKEYMKRVSEFLSSLGVKVINT